jgi:hypothetical protein
MVVQGAVGRGGGKGKSRAMGRILSGAPRVEDGPALRSYYHSRTAMPMTPEDIMNGQDTDDETDMEGFKV